MKILSPVIVIVATALSITISVRVGALALALGLALLAAIAYRERGRRTPWRSQRSDLVALATLALLVAAGALILP